MRKVAATTNRAASWIFTAETSKSTLAIKSGAVGRQQIQDTIGAIRSPGQSPGCRLSRVQQWDEVFTEDGTVDYSVERTVGSYRICKMDARRPKHAGRMSSFSHWQQC